MVRVKVCGITRPRDAELAARLDAWAVGLVFADSPRRVSIERARDITAALDLHVLKVGVFVDASKEDVERAVRDCGLDAVQLHGAEDAGFCRALKQGGVRVIKVLRMKDRSVFDEIPPYEEACDFLLLDSYMPGRAGGTGKTFDWEWAGQVRNRTRTPVILSGGLNPDNVLEALKTARPYAIDLSSGLEEAPGRKSPDRVKALFSKIFYF